MRQNYINFPLPKQTGLPSGSTFLLDAFNQLHAIVWFYCFIIIGLIIILFVNIFNQQLNQLLDLMDKIEIINDFKSNKKLISLKQQPIIYVNPYIVYDNWLIELIILTVPFIIIILICIPSTALSYSIGEIHNASATLKVTGEQWSWYNEVTVPVTKFTGYKLNELNQVYTIARMNSNIIDNYAKIKDLKMNLNVHATITVKDVPVGMKMPTMQYINKYRQMFQFFLQYKTFRVNINNNYYYQNYNDLYLHIDQQNNLLYSIVHEKLFLNNLNSLIYINLKFLQTKLPLIEHNMEYLQYTQNTKVIKSSQNYHHNLPLTNIAVPLPSMVWTKLTVDSKDVIHSYWLWDYGVKLDCIPGNPLQTYIFPKKYGISTGSCAEYCGNGHLSMPIIIKSYDLNEPITFSKIK